MGASASPTLFIITIQRYDWATKHVGYKNRQSLCWASGLIPNIAVPQLLQSGSLLFDRTGVLALRT